MMRCGRSTGPSSAGNLARLPDRPERQSFDEKVLNNFLEGERLTEIPVSRRKRTVILRWLAGRFEPESIVFQAEVNRIIKRHHGDCATLRRELIGYGCSIGSGASTAACRNPNGEASNLSARRARILTDS